MFKHWKLHLYLIASFGLVLDTHLFPQTLLNNCGDLLGVGDIVVASGREFDSRKHGTYLGIPVLCKLWKLILVKNVVLVLNDSFPRLINWGKW